MKYFQKWSGYRVSVSGERVGPFDVTVPGNIQEDYGRFMHFPDVMYGSNCRMYEELENDTWEYVANVDYCARDGERVFFVSRGIDYAYQILLDGVEILSGQGMFSPVTAELTGKAKKGSVLTVRILPHPKRPDAPKGTRDEADRSCKPPVCYGWDWNPRLLISGLWQETYVETRNTSTILDAEVTYTLAPDFSYADVRFAVDCAVPCEFEMTDAEGNVVYSGTEPSFRLPSPHLWWCNGQGEPYLYRWTVRNPENSVSGTVGFRRVRLLRNIGSVDPPRFPKSRYDAPFSMELNGRRIFLKGSNWVNPGLFWGRFDKDTYKPLLDLVSDAHMNILRVWGGASFCKDPFYELCDEMGILVWQEFMLACNAYPDDDRYLSVLEKEASFMIRTLRRHPCLALWCGGNELFNTWSGMSDQSKPLRLLNKLCYEYDCGTPFMMTSPLNGMGHGGYVFLDRERQGGDVFQSFQKAKCTGYCEFGVPSISELSALRRIIPPEELNRISPTDAWKLHHAIGAWLPQSHACLEILTGYFGENATLEDRIRQSDWLQSEGLKGIFEEARRQAPHCGGALNWAFNEPWITAANLCVVRYPATPKPAYRAVCDALRPVLFSARVPKFDWKHGEVFRAGIWMLNDSPLPATASVNVYLQIGEEKKLLLRWDNAASAAGENTEGAQVCCTLPDVAADRMTLLLVSDNGEFSSAYELLYRPSRAKREQKTMNL